MHHIRISVTEDEARRLRGHADAMMLQVASLVRAWVLQSIHAQKPPKPLREIPKGQKQERILITLPDDLIEKLGGQKEARAFATGVVCESLELIQSPSFVSIYPLLLQAA